MNTLLLQLMGFLVPVALKLVDMIRKDQPINVDYVMIFGMFFACYILVVYFREMLPFRNGNGEFERAQLQRIKRIAQEEIDKRIDEL